jgi:hypothetical protein
LDTSVPMTHRERLRAAKVTQAQWDGWMRNPRFAAYLEQAFEDRLPASIPLAHQRLVEAVDRGERWAIELLYRITGRFDPNATEDPRIILAAVREALDDEDLPAEVLQRVGAKLRELAQPGSAAPRPQTVRLQPIAPREDRL